MACSQVSAGRGGPHARLGIAPRSRDGLVEGTGEGDQQFLRALGLLPNQLYFKAWRRLNG